MEFRPNIRNTSCCSVSQLCPTLCGLMDCSTPGFPVLHYLPELAQTWVYWIQLVMPSSHLLLSSCPHSSCLQSFPASGSFLMSQLFASDGQSIGGSASASILPMNIQGWFPLGLTGLSGQLSGIKYSHVVQPSPWPIFRTFPLYKLKLCTINNFPFTPLSSLW